MWSCKWGYNGLRNSITDCFSFYNIRAFMIIRNPQNSIGNHLGPYSTELWVVGVGGFRATSVADMSLRVLGLGLRAEGPRV